jgi:hypothetical protein
MIKIIIPSIVIMTFIIAGHWYVAANTPVPEPETKTTTTTFSECVAAGNPILESFPLQCTTADGKIFTNTAVGAAEDESGLIPTTPTELADDSENDTATAMKAVRTKASQEYGVANELVDIVSVTEHTWPDGCLGLAAEGQICIMMLTYGYEITVSVTNQLVTYRTDQTGAVVKKEV